MQKPASFISTVRPVTFRNILHKAHPVHSPPRLIFMMLIFLVTAFSACNRKHKNDLGTQPMLDSTSVVQYIRSEPRFKAQLDWAKKFYRERHYKLGWFKNNQLVPQAAQMLGIIKKSTEEGLDPKDYQIKDFTKLFADLKELSGDTTRYHALEKEIDMALSATYFNWASDYYRGLVIPREHKEVEWDVKRNKIKLQKALMTVLGERKSKYPYANFKPLHPEYSNLKTALAKYRRIQAAGGWPVIPVGTKLKPGDNSPAVRLLHKRLFTVAGETSRDSSSTVYDAALVAAVKSFQEDQGLKADGHVRGETLRLLNLPVGQRIKQIILNMERWRWIPKSFEPDYLLVNIPEYKLHVFEKGREKLNMKVIVGKTMNSTPIFSDRMEYIVLSPYWNVPVNILQKEIVPNLLADPTYLERLDMEVVTRKGEPVDASSVDWSAVGKDFKYIVRRRPGPKNDLGDVKFIFPNSNDIYLHDTPHDELFSQEKRGFSHGCVRVEKPVDLAVYLLRNNPGWSRSNILSTIAQRREKFVALKQKLPVYLVYFTAWADAKGNTHFREDIYGHDKTLAARYFN